MHRHTLYDLMIYYKIIYICHLQQYKRFNVCFKNCLATELLFSETSYRSKVIQVGLLYIRLIKETINLTSIVRDRMLINLITKIAVHFETVISF